MEEISTPPHREAPKAGRASYRASLGIGALSFALLLVTGLISAVATARIYGIDVIGQFALVTAPVNAVWYLSSVREQVALVRELAILPPREPRVTALFVVVFVFSLGLTVVVAGLMMIATYFVFAGPVGQPELFMPALISMLGYVVITNTGWNYDSVLTAFRAARQLFWIRLNQLVVFLAVAVGAGIIFDTVWGLVFATLASSLTSLLHRAIAARAFMRTRVPRSDIRNGFQTLPELLKFGLKITPGSIADGISNEAGTWVLGITGSVAAVGAYSRAWTLGRRFLEMTWRITEMLYPTLVQRRAVGDYAGFDRALIDSIRYSAAGMLLPAAVGGGTASGIMAIFGPGFSRAAGALTLLLLMPAMFTALTIQRNALFSVDRPVVTTISATLRMVVTLALAVPLTLRFDETGMALAMVSGLSLDLAYMSWTTRRHLSEPVHRLWSYRQMLAIPLAYACGFGVARIVYLSVSGVLGVLAGLIAGTAAFVFAVVVAGGINSRDRERLASVVAVLRRSRFTGLTPQTEL